MKMIKICDGLWVRAFTITTVQVRHYLIADKPWRVEVTTEKALHEVVCDSEEHARGLAATLALEVSQAS